MYSMNYKEGLIYKIICKTDNKICYIGSTFNILSQRWRQHKEQFKQYIKKKKNKCISIYPYIEKYGIENFKMIEIKKYKVCAENINDKKHLSVYELFWILKHKNCINEKIPFNPLKKLDKKIYKKKYRNEEQNKDKIKDYNKKWNEENKNYQKNYYQENKYIIESKSKKKVECECGCKVRKDNLLRHFKSKKHINYIDNLGITI